MHGHKSLASEIGATKKAAKEVLRRAIPGVIRLATVGILDVGPMMEKEVGQALTSYAEDKLVEYREATEVSSEVRKRPTRNGENIVTMQQESPFDHND